MANPFNIYSNCYNGRLLVSLCIEVDNNQLSIQDYDFTQAPVLRHGNITVTSVSLQKHLFAECHLLGVHNVARVKRGRTRPLFEVDFTNLTELRKFCKSLEEGTLQKKLHIRLQGDIPSSLQLQVLAELHLIVPINGEWQLRSVTSSNCQECLSLIVKSEAFKFTNFDLITSILHAKSLSIDDLSKLLCDLIEVAPNWYTFGALLVPNYHAVEAIKSDHGDKCSECLSALLATWLRGPEASPSSLVKALASTGMVALAKKVAGNFGISLSAENPSFNSNGTHNSKTEAFSQPLITVDACKAGIQLVEQNPSLEPALIAKRNELVVKDVHYHELTQTQKELQRKKENVIKALADTKSTLGELNHHVNKLKSQRESLAAEREKKQIHHHWFTVQRESKHYHGQDLTILNEVIEDTVTLIKELAERMKELEEEIAALEGEAKQQNDKLFRQERERDSLQLTLENLEKELASVKSKFEHDRMFHKEDIERMLQEKKTTNEILQRQKIEIATQEVKIETMEQELKHRRDLEKALALAGETMTPIAGRKRNPDSGYYHDESSTLVTKSSECEIVSMEDEQRKSLSHLLTTQESNVNCLKVNVELRAVLRGIKSSGRLQLVTDHQVKCILLNIEDIYQFNKEILDSLQICVDNWRDWSIHWSSMSSILSRIVQNLEMYDTYFKGLKDAMLNLTKLMGNEKVDLTLKSFEKKQDLVLLHWMLEPLAILPKFCGKLEGYYKCLPSHSDDKAQVVKGALSAITEHFYQEEVKRMGGFAKILTIKRTLKNCQGAILKPGRLFIKEGQLQKITRKGPKNRMFFLFSDVLLHTKPDGSEFHVKNEIPLQDIEEVIEPEVSRHPHTFEVISTSCSLILSASLESEKMHWMKCLNDAAQSLPPKPKPNHNGFGCKAPILVPDEDTVMCQLCTRKFTFIFRRHHCYACGKVVCEKCSSNEVYLEYKKKKMRVCFQCYCQATRMMLPQVLSPEAEDHLYMKKEGESVMDGYVTVQEGLQEVRYWYVLTKDWTLKKYKAHEDIRAMDAIPLPGYVVTTNSIRLHHPGLDEFHTFKPVSGDYNDWVAKLEQATKCEEMTPVRRHSKSLKMNSNVEKSSVATSSDLLRSHTMPHPQRRVENMPRSNHESIRRKKK